MYRNEVINTLNELASVWTTVREEIEYMIRDKMEECGIPFCVEDFGDYICVDFEDCDGYDRAVRVDYQLVGSNTWIINRAH